MSGGISKVVAIAGWHVYSLLALLDSFFLSLRFILKVASWSIILVMQWFRCNAIF